MKRVDIEFVNIQSHEFTRFHLQPGLNFILAEDNNVGKSTIFKVLTCAMQLPNVPREDIDTLIRSRTSQARATFKFDESTCTLWLFRGNNGAPTAFFELDRGDGVTARSLGAPACLREALDIVCSEDGKVVNFNDADSVQLIVQDTPKNDEVLAKVLIDTSVDNIKANSVRLRQQIQQDYTIAQSKLDDMTTVLSTMHYTHDVDTFNAEKNLLTLACQVADIVCEPWSELTYKGPAPKERNLEEVRAALRIYESLQDVDVTEESILSAVSDSFFVELTQALRVLETLSEAVTETQCPPMTLQGSHLVNANQGIKVLDNLSQAVNALGFSQAAGREMQRLMSERDSILRKLGEIAPKVQCPIKGEVFYSDEECVPCRD